MSPGGTNDKRRTNEQGKIGLLSLWAVERLSFAKSVNFNLSNHRTKGLPTVKTFVFFYKVYKILVVVMGSFPF